MNVLTDMFVHHIYEYIVDKIFLGHIWGRNPEIREIKHCYQMSIDAKL